MNPALNINDIISQVKQLDKEEQLTLLERIALLIRKTKDKNQYARLSDISGIGSSLWSNISIDEYIDQERQW